MTVNAFFVWRTSILWGLFAMRERIVLAYSGGLNTTVIIPWLKENYAQCEVIACCVDVGQCHNANAIEERAIKTGANKVYIINARSEFITGYIYPMVRANAIYEGKYFLGTSAMRPLIAKRLINIAAAENATAICHGSADKSNDQVSFELAVKAFAPRLKIIVPRRTWCIESREDKIGYLQKRGIELPVNQKEQGYNCPEDAPDTPEYVELDFENGVPVKFNGEVMPPVDLMGALNQCGGRNGVGIADFVEDRVAGTKSRSGYKTPGGAILYAAHRELESLCLDHNTAAFRNIAGQKFAELIYGGKWFTPLREALSAFVDKTQETVTGTVRLKLYKGNIVPDAAH